MLQGDVRDDLSILEFDPTALVGKLDKTRASVTAVLLQEACRDLQESGPDFAPTAPLGNFGGHCRVCFLQGIPLHHRENSL